MDLNIITGLLIFFLMVYMIYSRGKMFVEHKKGLETVSHRGNFQKIFTGKINLAVYATALVAALVGLIVFYINRTQYDNYLAWMLVFAVIIITASTDMLRTYVLYTTYYNDNGIYHDTEYIRYSSIKNFKPKRIPITTDVYLFNGDMHTMPTKALQFLEKRIVAKKK